MHLSWELAQSCRTIREQQRDLHTTNSTQSEKQKHETMRQQLREDILPNMTFVEDAMQ